MGYGANLCTAGTVSDLEVVCEEPCSALFVGNPKTNCRHPHHDGLMCTSGQTAATITVTAAFTHAFATRCELKPHVQRSSENQTLGILLSHPGLPSSMRVTKQCGAGGGVGGRPVWVFTVHCNQLLRGPSAHQFTVFPTQFQVQCMSSQQAQAALEWPSLTLPHVCSKHQAIGAVSLVMQHRRRNRLELTIRGSRGQRRCAAPPPPPNPPRPPACFPSAVFPGCSPRLSIWHSAHTPCRDGAERFVQSTCTEQDHYHRICLRFASYM